MRPAYLAATIRAAEEPLLESMPGVLMQRAAAGLASAVLRELRSLCGRVYGTRVLLVVGSGNNGGDALYAGVRLLRRGVRVDAWRTSTRVHDESWAAFLAAGGREADAVGAVAALADADLVVDGVLGIGGRPGLREPVALFACACADAGVPVVAVDLPSGLDADQCGAEIPASAGMTRTGAGEIPASAGMTKPRGGMANMGVGAGAGGYSATGTTVIPGLPRDLSGTGTAGLAATGTTVIPGSPRDLIGAEAWHFVAVRTVTFGGLKFCQVLEPAASACGVVELVDIGLDLPAPDLACWEIADVAAAWPFPDAASDKYSRGVVGLDTGSDAYPGAAVLSTLGATYAGAGMVRFAGASGAVDLIRAAAPNVVFGEGRVQARVLGCGWGDRADGVATVERALADNLPLVMDADALRHLPDGEPGEQVLLTPHAGELARLLGIDRAEVTTDPVAAVREAARTRGAIVLLKGATQYVCGPDGRVAIAVPGPAWSAQAGSGDVLAGICGTLLAAGLPPAAAALAGASVQALTAASAPGPHPPQRIAERLPVTIAALRR